MFGYVWILLHLDSSASSGMKMYRLQKRHNLQPVFGSQRSKIAFEGWHTLSPVIYNRKLKCGSLASHVSLMYRRAVWWVEIARLPN